ncbi:hypothetical protein L7F22_029679 [Adiantum nelumboides]|nr:hypothetical protein [Adiantum nelumboides]
MSDRTTVTIDAFASAHTLGEDVAKTNKDMVTLPDKEDDGKGDMKDTKRNSLSTMQSSKNNASMSKQEKIGKVEEPMSKMASLSAKMLLHMQESGWNSSTEMMVVGNVCSMVADRWGTSVVNISREYVDKTYHYHDILDRRKLKVVYDADTVPLKCLLEQATPGSNLEGGPFSQGLQFMKKSGFVLSLPLLDFWEREQSSKVSGL